MIGIERLWKKGGKRKEMENKIRKENRKTLKVSLTGAISHDQVSFCQITYLITMVIYDKLGYVGIRFILLNCKFVMVHS